MAGRREADGGEPTLVWERPEPPSRPAPSPLSRDRIVRAAIELADADGLDAVSLRKVAAALDAGPMRLYGYLATKDELLDLMVDAVYGEIAPAEPYGPDWCAALRSHAHRTRQAALRHEWFADLLGRRSHLGPNAMAASEAALAALYGAPEFGDIDAALSASRTVNAYVIGAIRREVAERRVERATGMEEQDWQAATGPYISRMLATGRYPTLAVLVRDADHPDPETAFDTGLDHVLAGIAAVKPSGSEGKDVTGT